MADGLILTAPRKRNLAVQISIAVYNHLGSDLLEQSSFFKPKEQVLLALFDSLILI